MESNHGLCLHLPHSFSRIVFACTFWLPRADVESIIGLGIRAVDSRVFTLNCSKVPGRRKVTLSQKPFWESLVSENTSVQAASTRHQLDRLDSKHTHHWTSSSSPPPPQLPPPSHSSSPSTDSVLLLYLNLWRGSGFDACGPVLDRLQNIIRGGGDSSAPASDSSQNRKLSSKLVSGILFPGVV